MVGVHADLRGEIEGYGEAGLAFAEEIAIALVGFDGGAEAGVLAHGPEAAAVHRWIDAAGVGEFAGVADGRFWIRGGEIVLRVEAIDGEAGERGEVLFAFGGGLGFCVGHFRVTQYEPIRMRAKAKRAQLAVPLQGIDYNLRARRNELSAKKKNNRAKATAAGNEPVGHVAGPGAQCCIEPDDSEKCEHGACDFEEELLQGAPKAVETSLARRGCR